MCLVTWHIGVKLTATVTGTFSCQIWTRLTFISPFLPLFESSWKLNVSCASHIDFDNASAFYRIASRSGARHESDSSDSFHHLQTATRLLRVHAAYWTNHSFSLLKLNLERWLGEKSAKWQKESSWSWCSVTFSGLLSYVLLNIVMVVYFRRRTLGRIITMAWFCQSGTVGFFCRTVSLCEVIYFPLLLCLLLGYLMVMPLFLPAQLKAETLQLIMHDKTF